MRMEIKPFKTWPGGQAGFWADWKSRMIFLEGGWGSGKTWIGGRKLLAGLIYNAFERGANGSVKRTRCDGAMVGPTYRSMKDFMFPAFESACDDFNVKWKYISKDAWYVLPQLGSKVRCRTADRPDLITGWEVAVAWGDEPARWKEDRDNPKNDPFLQLMGRIRGKGRLHQAYFTYTNEGDHTRVYEEAHAPKPERARYRARTKDNPVVADFYRSQLENLTPALAEQYLEGGAAALGGQLAYAEQFNHKIHVTDGARLVMGRPLEMALDFNIDPGMHVYLGQYLPDLDLFVIAHEIHAPRLTVRQAVVKFGEWLGSIGGFKFPELQVFGDATGKSEWPGTGQSQYEILVQGLEQLGITPRLRVRDSNPLKVDRVNAVNVALRDMAGRNHVVIHPQCERLLDDFRRVRWDDTGRDLDKKNKLLTHASDAVGYWIHYLRPLRRLPMSEEGGRISV